MTEFKKIFSFLIQRAPTICRGFFLFILTSCAAFSPTEFKDPTPWPFRNLAEAKKKALSVKFFTGQPNWKEDYVVEKTSEQINSGRWRGVVLKTLRNSHYFKLVEMDWKDADYDLRVYLEEETSYPPYMGLLSGVTLFMIPLRVEMNYKMTFLFSKRSLHSKRRPKQVKFLKEGKLFTWIHPFLAPVALFSSFSEIHGHLVRDLTQKMLIQLNQGKGLKF